MDFIEKFGDWFFSEFVLKWKFMLFAMFLLKNRIWERSSSWCMGQNGLGQSDCRIFKSIVSLEQYDEIASFLHLHTNSGKLMLMENFGGICVKIVCGHKTLKLAVSQ